MTKEEEARSEKDDGEDYRNCTDIQLVRVHKKNDEVCGTWPWMARARKEVKAISKIEA